MTQLQELNQYALDSYLRGEHGELMGRVAQQEIYERGLADGSIPNMTEEEMVIKLKSCGYVVFKPRGKRHGS